MPTCTIHNIPKTQHLRKERNTFRYVCNACTAERLRKLRADNPGYSTAKNKAWQAANPEKRAAHKAVEKALRIGTLQRRGCQHAGCGEPAHAHHHDYSKPLDVTWLCTAHHAEWELAGFDRYRKAA